jgi:hypothetical protein
MANERRKDEGTKARKQESLLVDERTGAQQNEQRARDSVACVRSTKI